MLARLQRRLVLGTLLIVVLLAAGLAAGGAWGWALAVVLFGTAGHALVLGFEFICLAWVNRGDPAPPPTTGELLRAWWSESVIAPRVFAWRQPFRHDAWPDVVEPLAAPASGGVSSPTPPRRGVVLVHGFICNRAFWQPWYPRLRALGIPHASVDLEPVFGSIDAYAAQIEAAVQRIEAATGLPPVLVCHSMGGLAARAWLRENARRGGREERVHRIITIGTPHQGTWLARWSFTPNGHQMRQGSPWLRELVADESAARRARFICYYSPCDNIVFPPSTAVLPGAEAHLVRGAAHVHMAFLPEVIEPVLARIAAPA
jgi:triacylglycerol lipase